jgi:hypothetical protein
MTSTIVTSHRVVVVILAVVLIAPLAAQEMTPDQAQNPQAPAESGDTQSRYQIRQYEVALRNAVLHAGEQLAERASQIVPGVQLAPATEPVVRFVPTPEGPVFDVQIPLLLDAGPVIMRMLQQNQRPSPNSPAINVAQPQNRVTGTGVVQADPMTPSPVQGQSFDPDKEYTDFARSALIDALLDNSAAVPIKDGQRLEIAASGLEIGRGPLYPDNSKKLMLVISAVDLLEFRQGKITRDEAKARIKEGKY